MEDYKDEFNDEKEKMDLTTEEEEKEIDHFSLFMFGTNSSSIRKNEKIDHDRLSDEKPSYNRRIKGDDWILGRGGGGNTKNQVEEKEENENIDAIANFINQIDLELLMKNVDMFMTSANDLKPIFKKITPFIKKWMD